MHRYSPETNWNDYLEHRFDYYPITPTGDSGYYDSFGFPPTQSHSRLDAPDIIPAGSMKNELDHSWAYDRYVIVSSFIVRGK